MRRHWGALLQSRQDDARGYGGKCTFCQRGEHIKCRNRGWDEVRAKWADCACRYMDHGVRPSQRMVDDIAAPEPEQNAYEKTIGLDR